LNSNPEENLETLKRIILISLYSTKNLDDSIEKDKDVDPVDIDYYNKRKKKKKKKKKKLKKKN